MKVSIILLLTFFNVVHSYSQEGASSNAKPDRNYYLQKSKSQKTTAWILLGAGVVAIAAVAPGNSNFNTTGTVAVIGGASIISSIPLFIAAGRNKRKALQASAQLKFVKYQTDFLARNMNNYIPVVSLKLDF